MLQQRTGGLGPGVPRSDNSSALSGAALPVLVPSVATACSSTAHLPRFSLETLLHASVG